MKRLAISLLAAVLASVAFAQTDTAPIDFNKARELMAKQRSGQTLSPEEQAFLTRAKAAYAAQHGGGGGGAPAPDQRKAPPHLTPLCDMSASDRYEGEDGGLYGGGSNVPPAALKKAAEAQLARIRPLNAEGQPAPDGKIVFVSLSMSNATMEFSAFKKIADADPKKSPLVTVVDCAQGGQAMAQWAPPDAKPWEEAKRRLSATGVTPAQVEVAWIKLANMRPGGSLRDHCDKLEADTIAMLHNARALFPNLRIAYLGSRIYGGYATTPLNPEPYAYEGAFAVRDLIQRQTKGDAELAEAKAPLLLWGPYLWADGTSGRRIDSLVWERSDLTDKDGTHPTDSGRAKVAGLLLSFCTSDPLARGWFARQ
jgi:hypothetical protein